jgi:hypothetical protein
MLGGGGEKASIVDDDDVESLKGKGCDTIHLVLLAVFMNIRLDD